MGSDAPSRQGPFCPSCDADLDGGEIPESIRKHYSPPHRWQRVIGLSDGDSIFAWSCPDCGHEWVRDGMERRAQLRGWAPPGARKDGASPQTPSLTKEGERE